MAILLFDPAEKLDYTIDWSTALGEDTISSSTWAVTPSGPTLSGSDHGDTTATVFIQSGTDGLIYRLVNTIVTADGRTLQRAIILRCEDY